MRKYSLMLIFAAALFCGCATRSSTDAWQNIFEVDSVSLCVRVTFPAEFVYEDGFQAVEGTEKVYGYNFRSVTGEETYTLLKIYNVPGDNTWALVPLSEQFPDEEKLYEINGHTRLSEHHGISYPERSAVLIADGDTGNIIIRGVIGEYLSDNTAVFFTIERMLREETTLVINEMKDQLDWFFINIEQISCK